MYIETSRPRLEGEKARLVSPVFSVAPKNPYGATNTAYCFSFYYHMYGQHIGSLNVYLRLKGQTAIENPLWSSSGNKGQHWNQARVNINPPTSFQVMACASHTRNGSIWFSEGGPVYADPFLLTEDFTASLQL
uniref:MAM domain-containing protein n=1 Tax=Accipiter nisus TaxID=211598 RepID=A0A8B9RQ75_9AVES